MSNLPVFPGTAPTTTTTAAPATGPTTTTTAPMTVNLPPPGTPTTTPTTSPTASAPAPSTFPGTTGNSALNAELNAIAKNLQGTTISKFFAEYKISSADQSTYLNPDGSLNANATYLVWYKGASQADRQNVQSQMVTAGLIPATNANGLDNSVALGAYTSLLGQTSIQGTDPFTYLGQAASPENALQNEISAGVTSAQRAASAPEVVTQTNPTTLAASLTNAFDQALGYAPDQAQIQAFIKQIQGQETAYGSAPRQEAKAQLSLAHAQESALNQIGPDGIDTVLHAYASAVNGTNLPGAGTNQGPANGAVPNHPSAEYLPAGTPLAPGVAQRIGPQGQVVGANIMPTSNSTSTTSPEGGVQGFVDNTLLHKNVDTTSTTNTPNFVHLTSPSIPAGTLGTTTTHGGLYALSPQDWADAKKLYPGAGKYTTPGQAPVAVQQAAMTALLQSAYDKNGGSWSKAVSTIASGSPFGTAEGTHLANFAGGLVTQVNSQIQALQNQINNNVVTTKVSAPDANAEASAAAKQADPVGYYAANSASWGQMLNQMLTGAPLMYGQSSSDTFSGPVPTSIAGTAQVAPSAANTGVK